MEWLDPWWSADGQNAKFHDTFQRQLKLELPRGHVMFGLPTKLIARGEGDDALFQIMDGSGRVAVVHLTWATRREVLPWPATTVFASLEEWAERCMRPQNAEYLRMQEQ